MTSPSTSIRTWITRTFTGRALVLGAVLKLVAFIANAVAGPRQAVTLIGFAGDAALVCGAVTLTYRLFIDAKRVLLWRVRRKLTLSYIFIGFVPALLIVAFFLIAGLLLFFNVSSYVMRTRVATLVEHTAFLAQTTALELSRARTAGEFADIVARRRAGAAVKYADVSYQLVPMHKACGREAERPALLPATAIGAGPWSHQSAPDALPDWVTCDGFSGLVAHSDGPAAARGRTPVRLAARAVAIPDGGSPGLAVVVDVPISPAVVAQFHSDTGVELGDVAAVVTTPSGAGGQPGAASPGDSDVDVQGRDDSLPRQRVTVTSEGGGLLRRQLEWVAFLDSTDWASGRHATATAAIRTSVAGMYDRISGAPLGRMGAFSFGQVLLILVTVVASLFLIIQVVAFGMGLALARSITGSVHELFIGTERVRRGDFTHKIAIRSRDQLGELAESFNSMTASIEDLLQQKAEKERLEQELRIARSIQMSLLPQGGVTLPGLSVVAHCEPAREVGGDYYDYLPIDEHRVGLLIADVAGKGTSAALYMAELKGIAMSLSQQYTSPRRMLIEANRIISRHLDTRSFITITYAVVDVTARTLTYARAGHCPLIYVPGPYALSRTAEIHAADGLVLGLQIDDGTMFESLLEEETLQLGPGDLFVFYTDGITEAMNAAGDCFGDARLADIVQQHADLASDELRERILRDVTGFAEGAPQQDDLTMLLLRVEVLGVAAA